MSQISWRQRLNDAKKADNESLPQAVPAELKPNEEASQDHEEYVEEGATNIPTQDELPEEEEDVNVVDADPEPIEGAEVVDTSDLEETSEEEAATSDDEEEEEEESDDDDKF